MCCIVMVNVRLSVLKIFKLKCLTSHLWKGLDCFSSALWVMYLQSRVTWDSFALRAAISLGSITAPFQGWLVPFWNRRLRRVKWTTQFSLVVASPSRLSAGGPWPTTMKVQRDLSCLPSSIYWILCVMFNMEFWEKWKENLWFLRSAGCKDRIVHHQS